MWSPDQDSKYSKILYIEDLEGREAKTLAIWLYNQPREIEFDLPSEIKLNNVDFHPFSLHGNINL